MELKIRIRADGTAELDTELGRVEGRLGGVGSAATQAGNEARPAMEGARGAVEGVGEALDDTTRSAGGFLDKLGGAEGVVRGLAAALAGFASKRFLQSLIAEHDKYERNMLRTEALIQATGAAAGFTAQELRGQARELALSSLESVDGVERAQQRLMTFTSVTGENFSRAIELSADLAAVTGGDLNRAVTQLGRALDEPTRGLDALSSAGVTFSEGQKEIIAAMVEAGDKAGAQALILDELAGKFGGLAEAQAAGWAGAVATMGQALEEARLALAEYFNVGERGTAIVKQLAEYVFQFNENLKAGEYDAVISALGAIVRVGGVYLGLVTSLKVAQTAGAAAKAIYTAGLWALNGGAIAAAASLGLVSKATLALTALYAAWELAKWAHDNFGAVQKAWIAVKGALHTGAVWLMGEFERFGANLGFYLTNPLDFARGKIAGFLEWMSGLGSSVLRFMGLDGLADRVKADLSDLRGDAAAEHQAHLDQIEQQTRQHVDRVAASYREMWRLVDENMVKGKIATDAVDENFRKMSAAGRRSTHVWSDIQGAVAGATGAMSAGSATAASATRDLAREVDTLRRRVDPAYRSVAELADAEFLLWEAARAGIISQDELADMIARVHAAADDAAPALREMGNQAFATAGEADPFARAWEEASNRIDRTFADAWRGAFDSFRAFARGLGNAFKQLLAELAHAAITRPILVSLGLVAGGGNAMAGGMPGAGGVGGGGGGFGFNPLSFLGGNSMGMGFSNAATWLGGLNGISGTGFGNMLGGFAGNVAGIPNWHFGAAGLLGGLAGNALFGGRGFSGLGGSIGSVAGYGIGSGLGALGSFGGPIGAIAGTLLGSALGSLFGSSGERFPRTVGSGTGTWRDGAFTGTGPDTNWQHAGEDQFGDKMDKALGGLQESFASRLGALFEAFDIDEGINTTVRVRLRRTSGRLVGEFFGTLGEEMEEAFRVHGQYGKDAKIEDAFEQFMEDVLSKGVVAAIEASRLPEYVKRMFDGLATSAEVDAAIASIVHFQDLVTRDVIGQAALDYELAGRTATEVYREQTDAVLDLAREYDGTLASTRELAAAYEQQQTMAYQLAMALHQVSDQVSALFGNLAKDIRESLMGERELYNHRRAQVDALVEAMTTMTDPAQILATADQIERLTRDMWSSLDESQRQAMSGGFLSFLEEIDSLTQQQIAKALDALEDDQQRIGDTIDDSLARVMADFEQAAQAQAAAAQQMATAAERMHEAVLRWSDVVSTPLKVDVSVKQPAVQPITVVVPEVGG